MKNKEMAARLEGMSYALHFAEENGMEELKKEIIRRGIFQMPLAVDAKTCRKEWQRVQWIMVDIAVIIAVKILAKEFGFGEYQIMKFMNAIDKEAKEYTNIEDWKNAVDKIKEECDIEMKIDWGI